MGDPVDGVVRVERREQGWLHVQVGRGKYVKRFNLRDTEARQLVEQIARYVDIRSVMGLTRV